MNSSGPTDDDDRGYDSEEERHQARLFYGGRERWLQQERARQATLLHGFQARKRSLQQLEEDLLRRRLRGEGGGQAGDHAAAEQSWGVRVEGQGGMATEAMPLAALRDHEKRWMLLEASAATASGLTAAEIPWPPVECPTAYLQGLVRLELQLEATVGAESGRASRPGSSRAARRAYAKACLRWHPDKFQHRLGRALGEGAAEGILARVQGISQGINRAWEEVRREWGEE
ncbi:hypothetical protein N2152v2_006795 [Parachlorella kessleri]